LLTIIGILVLLIGSRAGAFYTSPSRIASVQASGDERAILRFVTKEAIKNSIFFGVIAFLAVMWDKWWLTGPLAVLMVVMELPTILQDLVIAVTTIPVIIHKPRSIVSIVASTVVRLTGDALGLLYLGLVFSALLT
jgi:hypothetical protein